MKRATHAVFSYLVFVHVSAAFFWTALLTASVIKWKVKGWNLIYSQNPSLVCMIHSSEKIQHREEVTKKEQSQIFTRTKYRYENYLHFLLEVLHIEMPD